MIIDKRSTVVVTTGPVINAGSNFKKFKNKGIREARVDAIVIERKIVTPTITPR
tara:strand:+ start:653 stop:814 length:162 start_codon:yes stop_codon:yes gene_type:complete